MSEEKIDFLTFAMQLFAASVLGLLVLGLVILAVLYVIDVNQTRHTIRRNYPVIGRLRYWFEHMGEFFRQYFFALDREEMPFNRAQRSWVYRAAKNVDSTLAFGSTAPLDKPGTLLFVSTPFPTLSEDVCTAPPLVIGPWCRTPYEAPSFFNISGMSYGSLSSPAVQALSRGAKEAGCWLNTGEGGLSPHHLSGGCDLVMQIGTAKYGVRDENGNLSDEKLREIAAHQQVRMFELKISQGAKPGKGGILPGLKVTEEIAAIRGIPAGQDSISPNGHPEIHSVRDLLDMIHRIRDVTGKPVGIKMVMGGTDFFDLLCSEVRERGEWSAPDFIALDSADGGTGAAPQSLMDHAGLPIRESLPWLVDKLEHYGLRERIRLIATGKLVNPVDVAWALCAGADFVVSARGFMFALGCIQALQCNKNTCPTGITTHNKKLQQGLNPADKSVRVTSYAQHMVHEVGVIAHSCGVSEPRQLTRRHARMVIEPGHSESLDVLYRARHQPVRIVE
ncbi:FMN-binding glutamate synthase family protein [Porticoccus sp. W117]|uniref:FMN-binding glutamate synthase family protein n=1 Tax=Porticoccus sp. W117 TaxID=3054777 RepID=UPI0025921B30|nr:FMN-binding glutamate synthase family protein [Porticoccus sp. W117]MDM3871543.1 FMN-binding glutamate synthase family protein [Porticoccus sp. W117]